MRFLRYILVVIPVVALLGWYWASSWPSDSPPAAVPPPAVPVASAPKVVPPPITPAVAPPAQNLEAQPPPDPNAIPGERVIRFKSADDYQRFLLEARKRGINILGTIPGLLAVRVGASSDALLSQLLGGLVLPEVGSNYQIGISPPPTKLPANAKTALVPFDQNWTKAMGVASIDTTWGHGVKVAIVDTGVDPSFTLGGATIPSIDLMPPATTNATNSTDTTSHATAVASLIAGNGDQFTGLAPGSSLLSIQALSADGQGDTFTVAEAIIRAVDAGSQVINLSLGSSGDSSVMRDAVVYAEQHGVALIAASGNDGTAQIVYPAAYPGVLAVGSVDATFQPAYFSNYGSALGVMAPGVGLPASQGGSQSVLFSGTSASTATVSGAVAAILSSNPGVTPTQATELLQTYADDLGVPGKDDQSGSGMVDLGRVLQRNTPNIVDGAVSSQFIAAPSTLAQPVSLGITIQNRGTAAIENGVLTVQVANLSYTFQVPNLAPGKSTMETVQVYPVQLINNMAVISSQLSIPGAADSNLSNNTMTSRLKVMPAAPSP